MLKNAGEQRAASSPSLTIESWRGWRKLALGACGALLGVGSSACDTPYYTSQAFFANTTREPVNVRVQTLPGAVDCARIAGRSAELLGRRELFEPDATYTLGPGQALPLDGVSESFGNDNSNESARCVSLVQVLGFPDQLVFWPPDTPSVRTESKLANLASPGFVRNSLRLEGHGNVRGLASGDALEVTSLPVEGSGTEPSAEASKALGWSGQPLSGAQLLTRRDLLPDGCFSIDLGALTSQTFYLCVPEWGFPFEVGQMLAVSAAEPSHAAARYGEAPTVTRHLTVQVAGGVLPKLELWLNAKASQLPEVGRVVELGPPGRATRCGAYADPLSVEVLPIRTSLAPSEQGKVADSGRLTRALLGRADQVLVAPEGCSPEYAALGNSFDLLIVTTPE